MSKRSLGFLPLTLAYFLMLPALAQSQDVSVDPNDWAKKMFDSTSHDFGAVARNATVTHQFKVTNLYKEDVHIASVTASCGCTLPTFDSTPIKSRESKYVTVSMDTNRFHGQKNSTVTVRFDQPLNAVVTIPVKVYIRTDVVLSPGAINFGAVDKGAAPQRKMTISYAPGVPNWKITNILTNNKYLTARAVETSRTDAQVDYELTVTLAANAPVGDLRQEMALVTNDEVNPQVLVPVEARVEADVMVTPNVVQLGSVAPGEKAVRTVMLRGAKPFVIDKVECESAREAFKMPPLDKDAKPFHVISLTFTAPKQSGAFSEKFTVTIAGRREPVTFTARGTIETAQAPR